MSDRPIEITVFSKDGTSVSCVTLCSSKARSKASGACSSEGERITSDTPALSAWKISAT